MTIQGKTKQRAAKIPQEGNLKPGPEDETITGYSEHKEPDLNTKITSRRPHPRNNLNQGVVGVRGPDKVIRIVQQTTPQEIPKALVIYLYEPLGKGSPLMDVFFKRPKGQSH